MFSIRPLRPAALLMLIPTLFLGGCAGFSSDGGFNNVSQIAQERLGKQIRLNRSDADTEIIAAEIKPLLTKSLSVDAAVQIALLNNPGLQATYSQLGIAEADLVQAGRLRNPGFTYRSPHGGTIERTFSDSVVNLLTLPLATRIGRQRFEEVQTEVAGEVLRTAADTRRAYFEAVAGQQGVEYARQVKSAAEAGSELAAGMKRAGNWSKLDEAREQLFDVDATTEAAKAQEAAVAAREKLTRLMGLLGSQARYKIPGRLPELPSHPVEFHNAEIYAVEHRLDIQAARQRTASLATELGLTRATGFINVLDLGYINDSERGRGSEPGYEISVEIPLFDWGGARIAKAQTIYLQSANQLAATVVNARSEVRTSYQTCRIAYDLARQYRDTVVPLRKQISEENMLRYNGMLISVFELLADAREQVTSIRGYIDALKDYWIAETNLEAAMGGKLPAAQTAKGKQP